MFYAKGRSEKISKNSQENTGVCLLLGISAQVFSCDFYEIFRTNIPTKHNRAAVSEVKQN